MKGSIDGITLGSDNKRLEKLFTLSYYTDFIYRIMLIAGSILGILGIGVLVIFDLFSRWLFNDDL